MEAKASAPTDGQMTLRTHPAPMSRSTSSPPTAEPTTVRSRSPAADDVADADHGVAGGGEAPEGDAHTVPEPRRQRDLLHQERPALRPRVTPAHLRRWGD